MNYLDFGSMKLDYEYHVINKHYKGYITYLFHIASISCRDRRNIGKIVKEKRNIGKISKELEKIGYSVILKYKLSSNIEYYYIIKKHSILKKSLCNSLDLSNLD